jgi:genome maintenance exonuclease 1
MLIKKYDYTPINRETVEGKRLYTLPDGSRVPSVTTILDRTKPKEKQEALANWRKSVGEKKAQEITTEAAGRGTRMHKFLEDYVKNNRQMPDPGTNPYSKQAHGMAQQIVEHGLKHVDEIWGIEVPLYVPGLYAGTTDACGVYQGQPTILDYKQTNKPKKKEWIEDYFLQLCAYAAAHNEVHGTDIKQGAILMAVAPKEIEPGIFEQAEFQTWTLSGNEWTIWMDRWFDRVEQYYKLA